jgi:diguanylate cyclase (GGDEF)-like protein/PAS domain S-box-containing protein
MEWLLSLFALASLTLSGWLVLARRRARETEAQYQLLFEENPLPFWVFHRDTLRILEANAAAVAQYGYSRDEFKRMSLADIRPPEDVAEAESVARSAHPEERRGRVWRHVRRDGSLMHVSVHSADIVFRGQPARLVLAIDISERQLDEQRLKDSEQRFQLVARATSDAVFDWNIVTGESWRTDSFDALFGYRSAEMPPTIEGWRERVHPEDLARVDVRLAAFFASSELEWQDSYRFRRGDGGWAHVVDRGRLVRDEAGRPLRMVGGMVDVTRQHETEEALREREGRLAWQASHDELTGLLNRSALLATLEHQIGATRDCPVSLLYFEIDEFNLINDSLGHEVGDAVLREVARRLRAQVDSADCAGRIAGSEFLAVLRAKGASLEAEAARILEALAQPVEALGTMHYLGINAGLARCPEHGDSPERLFRNAGLATHEARRRGQHQLVAYSPEFERSAGERLQLVSRLHEALEKQEFELFFQPLYDVRTREAQGMEALVRWRHPERGLVPPVEFIPVCESSGLIVPLGRWVLREAARHRAKLVAAGWPRLSIAVNVSALQFRSGELLQDIPALVHEFALPPGFLELELTESLVMHDPESVIETMRALRATGAQIAIDDFGTGYSSMSYLHRLPVDKLKIDRSFVANVESDPHNAAICESILALARSFGLRVIAEGVETQAQLDWLREHGCDKAQGFLLSRPLPFDEVLAKLGPGGRPVEWADGCIAPAR